MARQRRPASAAPAPAAAGAGARPRNPNRVPLADQPQSGDSFGSPRNQFGVLPGTLSGAALANRQRTENTIRQQTLASLSGTNAPTAANRQRVTAGGGGGRMADVVRANVTQSVRDGIKSSGG